MTTRYEWATGEGGLDSTAEESAAFYKPARTAAGGADTDVLDSRIRGLKAWAARRPRDPFTRMELCSLAGSREFLRDPPTPGDRRTLAGRLAALARDCRAAVDDIPNGAMYDPFRFEVLKTAGDLANTASSLEVLAEGNGLFGAQSKYAADAVQIWSDCERYNDGTDPDGYLRMRRGFALVHDGQRNWGFNLLNEVAELRGKAKCKMFGLNFARLVADLGEHETAIGWLEHAVNVCGVATGGFDTDPHLAPLKKSQLTRFKALTAGTK